MNHKKVNVMTIMTILKYIFPIILTLMTGIKLSEGRYVFAGLAEVLVIVVLTNILMFNKVLGYVVNSILLVLYNAQVMVLFFANSYVTMLMLTNVASINALSGKAFIYISATVFVGVFSLLPVKRVNVKRSINWFALVGSGILVFAGIVFFGYKYSPTQGYVELVTQYKESQETIKRIEEITHNMDEEQAEKLQEFYHTEIEDFVTKDKELTTQPNVIVIFTEGLSQNVLEDPRGIMTNVAEYQKKSISFENYYNHTFATYRGLIGQLYSGYQLNDFDVNPLISIHSVLGDQGYKTIFINSEPNNADFTRYLSNMEFDVLAGTPEDATDGAANSISDKDVYEMLFDIAMEANEEREPFFLATYTFGTHASLDSTDQKYGDGKDAELNKFYDVDYQFGKFMEKFNNSPLADNTIIVFTADHSTYQDDSFNQSFPDYTREVQTMDRMPFFIYHSEVEPQTIDVNGKTTICFAATVLDYLDISAPNFFVGSSLFSGREPSIWERSYSDFYVDYSSENCVITGIDEEEYEEFEELIQNYYILKEIMMSGAQ